MLTEPKIDRESFEELVKRGREIVRKIYPGWTDDNESDPGMTLLELFAFYKEIQNFHMEQTGSAHLVKYLKLLGVKPFKRQPGRSFVTADVNGQIRFQKDFKMYAGSICFETEREQMVVGPIFTKFVTVSGGRASSLSGSWLGEGKELLLPLFGTVPERGDSFQIWLSQRLIRGEPYCLYLGIAGEGSLRRNPVVPEAYDGYGFLPPAFLELQIHRDTGWQSTDAEDLTWGLSQSGVIWFSFTGEMSEGEPGLRLILKECDYLIPPVLERISLSIMPVVQQETRRDLPEYEGTGFPNQRIDLEEAGLSASRFSLEVEEADSPGVFCPWLMREDLDSSGPEERHFRLEDSFLVFGNGFHGMIPEGRIRVTKWIRTLGKQGNIKSGTITSPECTDDMIRSIVNEWDVKEGRLEESPSEAFERYKSVSFQNRRAVTLRDYEELVLRAPGLAIEACQACLSPLSPDRILIAVKPSSPGGMGRLSATMERNLYCYLEEKRLIGTRITLVSPEYVALSVTCEVVGRTNYRDTKRLVMEAVTKWLSDRAFGQGIRYGKMFGYLETLSCVSGVKSLWLEASGKGERNESGDVLIPFNGLFAVKNIQCTIYTN